MVNNAPRRKLAYLSVLGTTQLHLRNPYVIAWWSAAFPGLGHLLLSKYVRGFLLFVWEVFINIKSHINLAIFYSFVGEFEKAKAVLNKEWMLLYIATYIFSIWDSYRTTIDLNKTYKLAAREDAKISTVEISSMEINYLDKRSPKNAFAWSCLMPGLGQVYIHRIIVAFFIISWWITICFYSKVVPAIHYSLLGNFPQAKAILNIQWLLNLPSVYGFAIYDAYTNTVENNKLFDWEQSKYFKSLYQSPAFTMPVVQKIKEGEFMYIISTFQHNQYLELALTALQMKGIIKEKIMVTSLDRRGEERKLFDSIHHSDGLSLLDLGAILGTIFMLLGSIYGFVLAWGPILWALIGLVFGFTLGLFIKLFTTKKYIKNRMKTQQTAEVVVIIECEKNQLEMVQKIMWHHFALGVSKLDNDHQPLEV